MALSWWQYFIFLSPSLSLLLLFTRLEPPSGIALEGGIKRRYIFYILDFYLFRAWSDDSRRFDSGYWFSWKYKIFDNCSRFVLINDFSEKCWFWCFEFRCRGDFRRNSGIFEIWFYDENLILPILTIWFWVYWWSDFRNFFIIFFFQFLQFKGIIIIWF